jgi:hypothetical protein
VYVLSPLPRHSHWRHCFAHPSSDVSLPRKGRRVGLCIVLFEAYSAFTRVTARTLALPPMRGTLTRRLQTFRHLHACSGCFRLERLPGGVCTRWKSAAFSRRTPISDIHCHELVAVKRSIGRRLAAPSDEEGCAHARARYRCGKVFENDVSALTTKHLCAAARGHGERWPPKV